MNENEILGQMEEALFSDFQSLSKPEQIRKIMLAGNAEFVIRMIRNQDPTTEVGKTAGIFLEALTRCLRDSRL